MEINDFERVETRVPLNNINSEYIEITVDSGAAENVMPEHMAPGTQTEYSEEQAAGVVYTAANGDTMPNRGKKGLHIITKEGQARKVNMQITDVSRALMSVAKVCDAGHTVLFTKKGGIITNEATGAETTFRRENNVYRMTVKIDGDKANKAASGFARQG